MSTLLELLREVRATQSYARLTDAIPYAKWLGISVVHQAGELLGKLSYQDMLVGNPTIPALHGGTIGALLESTAIFQLLLETETTTVPKTIDLTVDYLRSGRPTDVWARGIVTKHGRRVVNVRIDAWQEDRERPIASALAHFLLVPADADEARD